VRFFVAASRPTRSLLQEVRVIDVSNENMSGYFLLLKMALYTEGRVTFVQQSLINGAVRRMTNDATLSYRLMLINKWAALLCVTFEAGFVSSQESKATRSELLLNIRLDALGRDSFVRFVAIAAAHLAFKHRMMMRQLKRRTNIQVTLETSVGRLSRIDDCTSAAASLNVQTPGPVARLATHILCIFSFGLEAGMSGCPEVAHDLFVAG